MIHREDRFLDFRTRIRNAETHEEAEDILRDLTPARIRDTCKRIVDEHGFWFGGGRQFEDDNFWVRIHGDEYVVARKLADGSNQHVYHEMNGRILQFRPLRCWNILNVLEEICEQGEPEI